MSSIISKEKKVKVKAVTSIFISTILIVVLQKYDIINTVSDNINYARDQINYFIENYQTYADLIKLYAPLMIGGLLMMFIMYDIKLRDPDDRSIVTKIFIFISNLKPGNFGDTMIIIGLIFIVSIIFMLLNSRLSMKLIIPIVISALFVNKYPINNMPCACQEPGSWYRCGDSFHPDSKICKDLKLKSIKIAKVHGPLVKNFKFAYGLLPEELLPDVKIPHLPTSGIGRIPVPGKVKGPRLPDCEFDPFAEAKKLARKAKRAARKAVRKAKRAAKKVWGAVTSLF